ncbi:hypothetical protein ABH973_004001 [Bradyrhizobium ottawaense]
MLLILGSLVSKACCRGLLLTAGLVGVVWSAASFPAFWLAIPTKEIAARILADDRFRPGILKDALPLLQADAEPVIRRGDALQAAALIRLQISEDTIGRKLPHEIDRESAIAQDELKAALMLNPSGSFLWIKLYSVEIARSGIGDKAIAFLAQSYATGPLEAWIALRRNRIALAVYPSLSRDVQSKVASEFSGLVESDFVDEALLSLTGPGWRERDRLLEGLASVNEISREAFAKRLAREGLKVTVPGITLDERLWQR